jgi:hypothetical protein
MYHPLQRPTSGPDELGFDITVMPNKTTIIVEANVNLAANDAFLQAIDDVPNVESVRVPEVSKDPYTLEVQVTLGVDTNQVVQSIKRLMLQQLFLPAITPQ